MIAPGPLLLIAAGIVAAFALVGKRMLGHDRARKGLIALAMGFGVLFVILFAGVGRIIGSRIIEAKGASEVSVSLERTNGSELPPPPVPVAATPPNATTPPQPETADHSSYAHPEWPNAVKSIVSLASLAGFVSLTYLFIDAGRRGRYTWAIRAGSAAAFVGLCVLLLSFGPLASPGL